MERYPVYKKVTTPTDHAFYIKSVGEYNYFLQANKTNQIYVSLDCNNKNGFAKQNFDRFKKEKEIQLRKEFHPLAVVFDRKDNNVQAVVRVKKRADIFDRVDWENQHDWLVSTLERLMAIGL